MLARDQSDLLESRLWDHARLNLMLLYGGQRGSSGAQSNSSGLPNCSFSTGPIEV